MKLRVYGSYPEYVEHQKEKLDLILKVGLPEYDKEYREVLKERLKTLQILQSGNSVLCLAARLGTEVKSFLDLGCFAVGLDLNPGSNNPYVVHGDFHNIQYPDQCIDVVFTNSLDHALYLRRLINEIKRILKPSGIVILEIIKGREEGSTPGAFESLSWEKIDDVLEPFLESGFAIIKRSYFTFPWPGENIILGISR